MEALKKCHAISKTALQQVRGIVRAFVENEKVHEKVDKIVSKALTDMGIDDDD